MKKTNHSGPRKRTIFLFSLLALLCIGIAELVACYFFDPPLYQKITAPARQAVHIVSECSKLAVSTVASEASALWDRLTVPKDTSDPLDSQLAGNPALSSSATISDPSITELQTTNGQEILTGGVMPVVYFNQGEEPWASQPYGSDTIGGYGCGPVAMAMAVSSMTEQDIDPAQMAQWASKRGYWAKSNGSYLSIVNGIAAAHGLTAESIEACTVDAVQEALLSGKLLVALMGPGHFTQGGHFILVRGITLSGSLLVADPNSTERSLMEWDPQLILDELSPSTANGAPLWMLSPVQS